MKLAEGLPVRFPLMLLAAFGLLSALWAALARAGWNLPALPVPMAGQHGMLMIAGFLGTLICVERAVAIGYRPAYVLPVLSGLGAITLLMGLPIAMGRGLIALAALGLTLLFAIRIYQLKPAAYSVTMALGALAWLIGGVLWWGEWATYRIVPWWAAFLILTIAGERLELARVLMLGRASMVTFIASIGVFVAGLLIELAQFEPGVLISGIGLIALGLWLVRNDIARRTIRQNGLTRYIAACLLLGHIWLIVGGALWIAFGSGLLSNPLLYDAMLHAVFLGFVFSMIFGHAPIIVPSVVHVEVIYRPAFYVHLALLHLSLIVRVAGDLAGSADVRMSSSLFNVLAVLIFLPNLARSMRRASMGL